MKVFFSSEKFVFFVFTLFFHVKLVYSSETSTGQNSIGSNFKSIFSSDNSAVNKKEQCSSIITKSIEEDQNNSLFIKAVGVERSKRCGGNFLYPNTDKSSGLKTEGIEETNAKAYFKSAFGNRFSSAVSSAIDGCEKASKLKPNSPEYKAEQNAIASRYYNAALRTEELNSKIAQEVSYIDSLLPNANSSDFECSEMFPQVKKHCPQNRAACSESSEKRLTDLAEQTKEAMSRYAIATQELEKCKSSVSGMKLKDEEILKKCSVQVLIINQIRGKYPWLSGEEFNKLAKVSPKNCTGGGRSGVAKSCSSFEVTSSVETIKTAIQNQLQENRKALIKSHKESLNDFRCLLYGKKDDGASCDQKIVVNNIAELSKSNIDEASKIRRNQKILNTGGKLDVYGNTIDPNDSKYTNSDLEKMSAAQMYLIKEQCYITSAALDNNFQQFAKETSISAILDLALIGLTGGLSAVANSAKILSKLGRFSNTFKSGTTVLASLGADSYYAADSIKNVYKECTSKKDPTTTMTSSEINKQNMCSDSKSPFTQAQTEKSNCIEDGLWALLDVGSAGSAAKNLISMRKSARATMMANVTDAEAIEKTAVKNIVKGPSNSFDVKSKAPAPEKATPSDPQRTEVASSKKTRTSDENIGASESSAWKRELTEADNASELDRLKSKSSGSSEGVDDSRPKIVEPVTPVVEVAVAQTTPSVTRLEQTQQARSMSAIGDSSSSSGFSRGEYVSYTRTDGKRVSGEVISRDEDGVVVLRDSLNNTVTLNPTQAATVRRSETAKNVMKALDEALAEMQIPKASSVPTARTAKAAPKTDVVDKRTPATQSVSEVQAQAATSTPQSTIKTTNTGSSSSGFSQGEYVSYKRADGTRVSGEIISHNSNGSIVLRDSLDNTVTLSSTQAVTVRRSETAEMVMKNLDKALAEMQIPKAAPKAEAQISNLQVQASSMKASPIIERKPSAQEFSNNSISSSNAPAVNPANKAVDHNESVMAMNERDGIALGQGATDKVRANIANELGITNPNSVAAISNKPIVSKNDMDTIFTSLFPSGNHGIDNKDLRQMLAFDVSSGYVTGLQQANARKFVDKMQELGDLNKKDLSGLTKNQVVKLNQLIDRVPLYAAKEADQAVKLTKIDVDAFEKKYAKPVVVENGTSGVARQSRFAGIKMSPSPTSQAPAVNPAKKGVDHNGSVMAMNERDGIALGQGATDKVRANIANELGITNPNNVAAITNKPIVSKNDMDTIFTSLFPSGNHGIDNKDLRQMLAFDVSSGYVTVLQQANAKKFVDKIQELGDINKKDLSGLTKNQVEKLNQLIDRVPLYAAKEADQAVKLTKIDVEAFEMKKMISDFRGNKISNEEAKLIKNNMLDKASNLSDAQRINLAEYIVGNQLTEVQKKAIIKAHEVGITEGRGFGTYTQSDITQKAKILAEAKIGNAETRRLLMESGVTGQKANALQSWVVETSVNYYRGKFPNLTDSQLKVIGELSLLQHNKVDRVQFMKSLYGANVLPDDANKIWKEFQNRGKNERLPSSIADKTLPPSPNENLLSSDKKNPEMTNSALLSSASHSNPTISTTNPIVEKLKSEYKSDVLHQAIVPSLPRMQSEVDMQTILKISSNKLQDERALDTLKMQLRKLTPQQLNDLQNGNGTLFENLKIKFSALTPENAKQFVDSVLTVAPKEKKELQGVVERKARETLVQIYKREDYDIQNTILNIGSELSKIKNKIESLESNSAKRLSDYELNKLKEKIYELKMRYSFEKDKCIKIFNLYKLAYPSDNVLFQYERDVRNNCPP